MSVTLTNVYFVLAHRVLSSLFTFI